MERKQIVKMLREIRELAGEASLTGMFRKGTTILISHYNASLQSARKQNFLGENDLFRDLAETASMDDVGISAGLLAAFLDDYES